MATYTRCIRPIALLTPLLRDQRIKEAWESEGQDDGEDGDVGAEKAEDVQGVVADGDEGRVGERKDDCQDRGGEIAEDDLTQRVSWGYLMMRVRG